MQALTINGWKVYRTDCGFITASPRGHIMEDETLDGITRQILDWAAA